MPFQQSTVRFLSFPSPSTLSQTVLRRCFCCGSSVLHAVMSVYVRCCSFFKCFILTLTCAQFFYFSNKIQALLVSKQQLILFTSNRLSQNIVSNTPGVASNGCNRLRHARFRGYIRLGRTFAAGFVICDRK